MVMNTLFEKKSFLFGNFCIKISVKKKIAELTKQHFCFKHLETLKQKFLHQDVCGKKKVLN